LQHAPDEERDHKRLGPESAGCPRRSSLTAGSTTLPG
jgi:hypothetical protein